MRRTLMHTIVWLIVLFLAILISEVNGQTFSGGSGTSEDPFQLSGFTDLDSLQLVPGYATGNYYFILTNNINMSTAIDDWNIPTFNGFLDGKGYTIRHWTDIGHNSMNFIHTLSNNRWIKNLRFANIELRHTSAFGAGNGGLFAILGTNSILDSIVIDSTIFYNRGTVSGGANPGTGFLTFKLSAVGVQIRRIAIIRSEISLLRDISGTAYAGMFVGRVLTGGVNIEQCYIDSTLFIVGETTTSSGHAGWFIGMNDGNLSDSVIIRDCYVGVGCVGNTYATSETDRPYGSAGGITETNVPMRVENFYANFTVNEDTTKGYIYTNFQAPNSSPWGFYNVYYDSSKYIFGLGISSTHTLTIPTPYTTAQMQDQLNYTGFDFLTVWVMNSVTNYPELQWANGLLPARYFRLVDLRPDTNASVSLNSTVGVGWETTGEIIEFDSLDLVFSGEANIDRIIDSTVTIANEEFRIIAKGLNITAVFDSVYSRPNPTDDTSHITGSGILADPYVLYNVIDLDSTRFFGTNKYYALGADIDMSPYPNWSSHLVYRWNRNHFEYPNFGYGLDGRGYTIKNLTMISGVGGGPTTFISLKDSDNNHVKNVIFDSCSISMTGNPYAQILAGEFWYNDNGYVLGTDKTNVTFIESNQLVENIVFTNCSISVNMDTLYSYIRVGYVYKANIYTVDTLRRVGLENCTFNIYIDGVKIYDQSKSYRDFYIAMLSPTTTFSQGGICWIDSNSIMTVDIGSFVNRDTTKTHALYMGSIASGSGATMYDVNADGIYSWTVSSDWLGRIDTTSYRHGYYGLLSGYQPRATSYNGGKNYMKRNLFIGKLTTNIDTLSGVTYNATDGTLYRMGSSYYNTDSANVSGTFKIYQDNIFVGIAIDSNGVTTDSLKSKSGYKYAIYHERFTQVDTVNGWDFTYGNWRMSSSVNRGYPHIYGQNGIADTNWTYTVADTIGIDTILVSVSSGIGCGITYEINIDTVAYVQDIALSINRIDIVTETYYIDSLDLYYAYTDEVDTIYQYLGRLPIDNTQSYWDTTTFSYDIAETGIEATRPMVFKASVEGIFPLLDEYKEGDVETQTALPDQTVCQAYKMLVDRGGIGWRRIKDGTCGWVGGAHITLSEGSFTGVYTADPPFYTTQTLKPTFSTGSSTSRPANFNTACRPSGSRGYNLQWDDWLCDFREADTLTTLETYTQCGYLFTYAIVGTTVTFHNTFDDSTRIIAILSSGSDNYSLSLDTQKKVGAVGGTTGLGWMVIFKLSLLITSADPAEAVYYYGTPGGEGGEPSQPLGNIFVNRFRGIHPKIWKWGRQDGTRPDSIYIMTPDGPIKVKL